MFGVENRSDVQDFLQTRRARLTPEQVGLGSVGGTRRVKGLRREEVAAVAGVSVDYYNKMERGNLHGVSDSVLEAIASAASVERRRAQSPVRLGPHCELRNTL